VAVSARTIALTGADQLVCTGGAIYRGIVVRETAAAVAVVRVYDGTTTAGTLIDEVSLAASGSASLWYGDGGIWCSVGIFVDVVGPAAVEGSVRVG